MARNFYLRKQSEIVSGSANFAAMITADAVALGLVPAQATAFGLLNTALQSAWTTSSTPETRTSVAVEATRIAIKNMRAGAMPIAKQIVGNPAVTDAQLLALGLLPRTSPGPIPPTMTPPEVDVVDVIGRLVRLRIRQAGSVESKSKPVGSAGAQIYTYVGATAPSDPNLYKYQGLSTRGIVEVLFDNDVASGATAWIAAAWVSQRGQRGFACTPVSVTIQGGPVLAEAA
jgi:hypothetical protein